MWETPAPPCAESMSIAAAVFERAAGAVHPAPPCVAPAFIAPGQADGRKGKCVRRSQRSFRARRGLSLSPNGGSRCDGSIAGRVGSSSGSINGGGNVSNTRCRFAVLSLSGWRARLPKLTERSAAYDPWDVSSEEAPRGVRRRNPGGVQSHPAAAAVAQSSAPSAAAIAGTTAVAPPPQPLAQQQQQQQAAAQPQPCAAHGDEPHASNAGRLDGSHTRRIRPDASPKRPGLPTWLVH